ncbi:unnamed protein product [Didymodactylos carnosus]|uniref:Uncharacterized protein n=1 Tax=Didymodactylos carnosus TaxID=1234261 RepID=A0A813VRQ4_9BILA|nr:unnamed protein product [Didymodactylos carnosus]CAF3633116.1 unnamed protein product [Didymodactylos carnosus]
MGPRFFMKVMQTKSSKYMRSESLLSSRLNVDEKLLKLCEETHDLYTTAKDSLLSTIGTSDVPDELQSIRSNFIEQLKTGLGFDSTQVDVSTTPKRRSSVGERRGRIRAKATTINLKQEDDSDVDEACLKQPEDNNGRHENTTQQKKRRRIRKKRNEFTEL